MINETCKNCIHTKVCRYTKQAEELSKQLPKPDDVFYHSVTCTYKRTEYD